MKNFEPIIEKYTQKGIKYTDIEYAISEANEGTRREIIMDSLTADYRAVSYPDAFALLEDIYKIIGGEFKKENKKGYTISILLLVFGLASFLWIYLGYLEEDPAPGFFWYYGILSTAAGIIILGAAIDGRYRENV